MKRIIITLFSLFLLTNFSVAQQEVTKIERGKSIKKKQYHNNSNSNSNTEQENPENPVPGVNVLGWGYDIFGSYGSIESLMNYCIFDYKNFENKRVGTMNFDVPQYMLFRSHKHHTVKTVSGSSEREYAKSLSASIGMDFDAMLFSASVSSSFNFSESGSKKMYYFTYMDGNPVWYTALDIIGDDVSHLKPMLNPRFKKYLNDKNFSPKTLFETYGTHYIASAYLGGRIDFKSKSVITEKTKSREIGVAVQAQYQAVSANASLDTRHSETLKNAKTETTLDVIGGNSQYINSIHNLNQYETWATGLQADPSLCDFEEGSLRPIWEFCDDAARKKQLKDAFYDLLDEYPLPEELADLAEVKGEQFMVRCKESNLYWDFPGYHYDAKYSKGTGLCIYPKDGNSHKNQGFDRVYTIKPNEIEKDYVHILPQHSFSGALDIPHGEAKPNLGVQLYKYNNAEGAQLFKMIAVDGEKNTFYIQNKKSGLYLEIPKGKANVKDTKVVQNTYTGADNQKWVFETFDPANIAPPPSGYYTVKSYAGKKKYWDFSGTYPEVKSDKLQLHNPGPAIGDRTYKFAHVNNGWYVIRPDHSPNEVLTAATKKELYLSNQTGKSNQLFRFEKGSEPWSYVIINQATKQAIDADAHSVNSSGRTKVQMWDIHRGKNQLWYVKPYNRKKPLWEGTYRIKSPYSSLGFDLAGNENETNSNGKNVKLWSFDGGKDQMVKFIPLEHGKYYKIEFQHSGKKVLDISEKSKSKGANIHVWSYSGSHSMQWKVVYNKNKNVFSIVSRHSGKALDAKGGKFNDKGTNIHQWDFSKSNKSQHWQFIDVKTKKAFRL